MSGLELIIENIVATLASFFFPLILICFVALIAYHTSTFFAQDNKRLKGIISVVIAVSVGIKIIF